MRRLDAIRLWFVLTVWAVKALKPNLFQIALGVAVGALFGHAVYYLTS